MEPPAHRGFRCAHQPNPQVALGRAIRLRREEIRLTQEALADAADLDATSIRGLERGTSNLTWDVADRVSRALGLALHELAQMADELETKGSTTHQPAHTPRRLYGWTTFCEARDDVGLGNSIAAQSY